MKILIVSGFLGAGKTTFIKELIHRTHVYPVVMENEYGDNNIDADELRQSASTEMKILEFMEGCVCCTMKDSFVNSVLTVSSSLDPEYLIVEPTGVGRLSSILDNLKPILYEKISLLKPVTVLSPEHCRKNIREWGELYVDQVRCAGTIVFSKCEHTSPDLLEEAAARIREINPNADITDRHYSMMPETWWRSIMEITEDPGEMDAEVPWYNALSGASIEQLTLNHGTLVSPADLILLLEDCLRGELGRIARAKGHVPAGNEMIRFDLADGLYALTGSSETKSQCVFIGKDLQKEQICRRLGTSQEAEGAGGEGAASGAQRGKPILRPGMRRRA